MISRLESNEFVFHPNFTQKEFKADVPFKASGELTATLLTDTLKKMVRLVAKPLSKSALTLYSTPVDTLYKIMMQESDNLISEQLLMICSQMLSDTLQTEIAIRYNKKNLLNDLND